MGIDGDFIKQIFKQRTGDTIYECDNGEIARNADNRKTSKFWWQFWIGMVEFGKILGGSYKFCRNSWYGYYRTVPITGPIYLLSRGGYYFFRFGLCYIYILI